MLVSPSAALQQSDAGCERRAPQRVVERGERGPHALRYFEERLVVDRHLVGQRDVDHGPEGAWALDRVGREA